MSPGMLGKTAVAAAGVFLLVGAIAWALLGGAPFRGRVGVDPGDAERTLAERETARRLAALEEKVWKLAALSRQPASSGEGEGTGEDGGAPDEGPGSAEAELLRTDVEGLEKRLLDLEAAIVRIDEQLAEWGDPRLAAEATKRRRDAVKSLAQAARKDAAARESLYALLADADPGTRAEALKALRDSPDAGDAARIRELLADEDPRVRREAIRSLRELGAADSADAILGLLGDPDDKVREEAAGALGDLNARTATTALSAAVQDPSPDVRREAMMALGRMGDPAALDGIAALYQSGAGNEALRAARILAENGRGEAYQEELRRLAEVARSGPDEKTRAEAVKSLARHARDDAQEVFTSLKDDPSPKVRNEAQKALGAEARR